MHIGQMPMFHKYIVLTSIFVFGAVVLPISVALKIFDTLVGPKTPVDVLWRHESDK